MLLLLPLMATCRSPVGPTEPMPPTGVIYFEYLEVTPTTAFSAVWRVLPDGSGLRRVPHPFLTISTPHVGLSGRWLAYTESGDVFVADLSNPPGFPELPQKDITFVGLRSHPLVSPSGSLVANTYTGPDIDQRGIRISRNDQSGVETLLTPPSRQTGGSDQVIGWFPGEDSLLIFEFPSDREYSIIHADGTGKRPIGIPGVENFVSVALSPTGRFVALAGNASEIPGSEPTRTITIYDLATGRPVRSVILDESVYEVIWSPDERFLAYIPSSNPDDPFDLAIVELATGARTVVLDIPRSILHPVWANTPPPP